MDNQNENVPENADKFLFAEDLVSYVMTDLFSRPYEGTQATPYRAFIHNAFNETVKVAVKHLTIRVHLVNQSFLRMIENISDPNESQFLEILQGLPDFHSSEGFDAKNFLFYCSQVVSIASVFRNNGLTEAPNLAVSRIFEHLRDYDMLYGGWNAVNAIASVIPNLSADESNLITPDSLSSSSPDVVNIDDEINFLNNSTSDGMDLSLLDKTHYATAAQEKKDEDNISVDDLANAFSVHQIMGAENLQSHFLSTSNKHLQPSDELQVVMENTLKSGKERRNEAKLYEVDLKGTSISNENIIAENSQLHFVPEILQTFSTFEVETANITISNVEISLDNGEVTPTADKQTDSDSPRKCLDESKEHENVQIFDSVEKCEKRNLCEDS